MSVSSPVSSFASAPHAEAAYPLSPMQEGMVFHSLRGAQSGVDIEQMVCTLREAIAAPALQRAWQRVAERHAILRTAFRWQGPGDPEQIVRPDVTIPFGEEDWSALAATEREARLAAFLAADRARGFDLAAAPLVRVALFRQADAEWTMVWTFHHALLDGRSFPLVLNEVFAFHEAFVRGDDIAPPLPRPYRDYIDWLGALDAGAAKAFWQQYLAGFAVPTPLPAARPAVAGAVDAYTEQRLVLPADETAKLYAFAREHQLSVNTLVQGAWALLLARYSGETDIVFGATRACRRSALEGQGTDTMVGIFINTVPLRVQVDPEARALGWLHGLRQSWRSLRDHEHTPLVKVREAAAVSPSISLFDTLFVFEDYLLDTSLRAQGGAWQNRSFVLLERTNFPLTLLGYGGPELLLKLEYERARFDEATIGRMLGHLRLLLLGLAEEPERALIDIPIVGAEERRRLVSTWNEARTPFPKQCIHDLVRATAARSPDAVALACGGATMTYGELDRRSNQLARYLQARGAGPGKLVAVCCERSIPLLVGLVGILKSGAAYVPLDPAYPKDRLAGIMEDCQAPLVLTQAKVRGSLPEHTAQAVRLDTDADAIAAEADGPVESGVTPEHLAYVIYTSGSTGRPKGVAIEHHSTVAFLAWSETRFPAASVRGMLFSTSVCFDLSIFEMFLPLSLGGTVIIAPNALHLPNLPERDQVTFINTVPTAINELVQMGAIPPGVRTVALAGEPLLNSLAQQIYAVKTVDEVWNLYGPTEDTTYSTWYLVTRGQTTPVTIGKVLSNSQAYIVDKRMRPVPVGVPGELLLGGEGLAREYLNRPELTAEKFVQNPFHPEEGPSPRLYRTGDLCRFSLRDDGEMEYLGRIDNMVKVRGFRIELGEIEAVLGEHPAVKESVVVVREDTPGDKRLAAYVAPLADAKTRPTPADLRDFVKKRLPDFMVPSAILVLDRLPLTPNGKIDRKALPKPEASADEARTHVAPRGPVEAALAALFAKVLKVPEAKVGVTDSFFELGGHSLLGLRLFSQIESTFGKKLPLGVIFQAPTVEALAKLVADGAAGGSIIEVTAPKADAGGARKRPLFWCGQSYEEVRRLGAHLGADQPLYLLESGFYHVKNPDTHIKELAARYVEEVVRVQPQGPYLLGGFCIDAYVAFDIAQRLEDRGQRVALVAMVDRDGPDRGYRRYLRLVDPIRYHAEKLVAAPDLGARVGYLVERFQHLKEVVAARLGGSPSSVATAGHAAPAEDDLDEAALARRARAAVFSYLPDRPYGGRVAMFFGEQSFRHVPTAVFPRYGWERTVTGALAVHLVPGDHESIVREPQLGILAERLRGCLDEVQPG